MAHNEKKEMLEKEYNEIEQSIPTIKTPEQLNELIIRFIKWDGDYSKLIANMKTTAEISSETPSDENQHRRETDVGNVTQTTGVKTRISELHDPANKGDDNSTHITPGDGTRTDNDGTSGKSDDSTRITSGDGTSGDGTSGKSGDNDSLGKLIKLLSGLMTGGAKYQRGGAQLTGDAQIYENIINKFSGKLVDLMKQYAVQIDSTNKGQGKALVDFLSDTWTKFTSNKFNIYKVGNVREKNLTHSNKKKAAQSRDLLISNVEDFAENEDNESMETADELSLFKKLPKTFLDNDDTINEFFNTEWKDKTADFQRDSEKLINALFDSIKSKNTGSLDSVSTGSSGSTGSTGSTGSSGSSSQGGPMGGPGSSGEDSKTAITASTTDGETAAAGETADATAAAGETADAAATATDAAATAADEDEDIEPRVAPQKSTDERFKQLGGYIDKNFSEYNSQKSNKIASQINQELYYLCKEVMNSDILSLIGLYHFHLNKNINLEEELGDEDFENLNNKFKIIKDYLFIQLTSKERKMLEQVAEKLLGQGKSNIYLQSFKIILDRDKHYVINRKRKRKETPKLREPTKEELSSILNKLNRSTGCKSAPEWFEGDFNNWRKRFFNNLAREPNNQNLNPEKLMSRANKLKSGQETNKKIFKITADVIEKYNSSDDKITEIKQTADKARGDAQTPQGERKVLKWPQCLGIADEQGTIQNKCVQIKSDSPNIFATQGKGYRCKAPSGDDKGGIHFVCVECLKNAVLKKTNTVETPVNDEENTEAIMIYALLWLLNYNIDSTIDTSPGKNTYKQMKTNKSILDTGRGKSTIVTSNFMLFKKLFNELFQCLSQFKILNDFITQDNDGIGLFNTCLPLYNKVVIKNKSVHSIIRRRDDNENKVEKRHKRIGVALEKLINNDNLNDSLSRASPLYVHYNEDPRTLYLKDDSGFSANQMQRYPRSNSDFLKENATHIYKYHGFENIFAFNTSNGTMAERVKDAYNLITNTEDPIVFVGYGQSGSGKTSTLVYFDGGGKPEKAVDGVVVELLKKFGQAGQADEVYVSMIELYHDKAATAADEDCIGIKVDDYDNVNDLTSKSDEPVYRKKAKMRPCYTRGGQPVNIKERVIIEGVNGEDQTNNGGTLRFITVGEILTQHYDNNAKGDFDRINVEYDLARKTEAFLKSENMKKEVKLYSRYGLYDKETNKLIHPDQAKTILFKKTGSGSDMTWIYNHGNTHTMFTNPTGSELEFDRNDIINQKSKIGGEKNMDIKYYVLSGFDSREIKPTENNNSSSRSHVGFCLKIKTSNGWRFVYMLDLAGVENELDNVVGMIANIRKNKNFSNQIKVGVNEKWTELKKKRQSQIVQYTSKGITGALVQGEPACWPDGTNNAPLADPKAAIRMAMNICFDSPVFFRFTGGDGKMWDELESVFMKLVPSDPKSKKVMIDKIKVLAQKLKDTFWNGDNIKLPDYGAAKGTGMLGKIFKGKKQFSNIFNNIANDGSKIKSASTWIENAKKGPFDPEMQRTHGFRYTDTQNWGMRMVHNIFFYSFLDTERVDGKQFDPMTLGAGGWRLIANLKKTKPLSIDTSTFDAIINNPFLKRRLELAGSRPKRGDYSFKNILKNNPEAQLILGSGKKLKEMGIAIEPSDIKNDLFNVMKKVDGTGGSTSASWLPPEKPFNGSRTTWNAPFMKLVVYFRAYIADFIYQTLEEIISSNVNKISCAPFFNAGIEKALKLRVIEGKVINTSLAQMVEDFGEISKIYTVNALRKNKYEDSNENSGGGPDEKQIDKYPMLFCDLYDDRTYYSHCVHPLMNFYELNTSKKRDFGQITTALCILKNEMELPVEEPDGEITINYYKVNPASSSTPLGQNKPMDREIKEKILLNFTFMMTTVLNETFSKNFGPRDSAGRILYVNNPPSPPYVNISTLKKAYLEAQAYLNDTRGEEESGFKNLKMEKLKILTKEFYNMIFKLLHYKMYDTYALTMLNSIAPSHLINDDFEKQFNTEKDITSLYDTLQKNILTNRDSILNVVDVNNNATFIGTIESSENATRLTDKVNISEQKNIMSELDSITPNTFSYNVLKSIREDVLDITRTKFPDYEKPLYDTSVASKGEINLNPLSDYRGGGKNDVMTSIVQDSSNLITWWYHNSVRDETDRSKRVFDTINVSQDTGLLKNIDDFKQKLYRNPPLITVKERQISQIITSVVNVFPFLHSLLDVNKINNLWIMINRRQNANNIANSVRQWDDKWKSTKTPLYKKEIRHSDLGVNVDSGEMTQSNYEGTMFSLDKQGLLRYGNTEKLLSEKEFNDKILENKLIYDGRKCIPTRINTIDDLCDYIGTNLSKEPGIEFLPDYFETIFNHHYYQPEQVYDWKNINGRNYNKIVEAAGETYFKIEKPDGINYNDKFTRREIFITSDIPIGKVPTRGGKDFGYQTFRAGWTWLKLFKDISSLTGSTNGPLFGKINVENDDDKKYMDFENEEYYKKDVEKPNEGEPGTGTATSFFFNDTMFIKSSNKNMLTEDVEPKKNKPLNKLLEWVHKSCYLYSKIRQEYKPFKGSSGYEDKPLSLIKNIVTDEAYISIIGKFFADYIDKIVDIDAKPMLNTFSDTGIAPRALSRIEQRGLFDRGAYDNNRRIDENTKPSKRINFITQQANLLFRRMTGLNGCLRNSQQKIVENPSMLDTSFTDSPNDDPNDIIPLLRPLTPDEGRGASNYDCDIFYSTLDHNNCLSSFYDGQTILLPAIGNIAILKGDKKEKWFDEYWKLKVYTHMSYDTDNKFETNVEKDLIARKISECLWKSNKEQLSGHPIRLDVTDGVDDGSDEKLWCVEGNLMHKLHKCETQLNTIQEIYETMGNKLDKLNNSVGENYKNILKNDFHTEGVLPFIKGQSITKKNGNEIFKSGFKKNIFENVFKKQIQVLIGKKEGEIGRLSPRHANFKNKPFEVWGCDTEQPEGERKRNQQHRYGMNNRHNDMKMRIPKLGDLDSVIPDVFRGFFGFSFKELKKSNEHIKSTGIVSSSCSSRENETKTCTPYTQTKNWQIVGGKKKKKTRRRKTRRTKVKKKSKTRRKRTRKSIN